MTRTLYPELVTGYELNERYGWFSILEPKEATNLCQNPSLEEDETGWTDLSPGGVNPPTTARTTDDQRRGAWSMGVTTDGDATHEYEGVTYAIDMTIDVTYGVSVDIKGTEGEKFRVFVGNSVNGGAASALSVVKRVTSNGYWQRISLVYPETATNTRYVCVEKYNDTQPVLSSNIFYVDGLQVEVGEVSTYFDGDSLPFGDENNYVWIGQAHASQSYRSSSELSSGVVRNLKNYGYSVLSFFGLGIHPQNNTILENAMLGGGTYQRGKDDIREYSLVGAMTKIDLAELMRSRAAIQSLLLNGHTMQQPMIVRAEMLDDCGVPFSQPLHMRSIYQGGFEGTVNNLYQERSSLQFQMDRPEILEDGDGGGSLSTLEEFTPSRVARRLVGDGWDDWDSGVNNVVWGIKFNPYNGKVYVYGEMTTAGPGATAVTNAAAWDIETETWEALPASVGTPTGAANSIHVIDFLGDGTILVGGEFTGYAGVAGDDYLVYYPDAGGAWDKYAVGAPCMEIAVAPDGDVFYAMCSDPTGAANAFIYKCTHSTKAINLIGTATHAVGNPKLDGACVGRDGTLYITGYFDDISGTAIECVAQYDGVSWSALGDGVSVPIIILQGGDAIEGDDGNIYIAGTFTTAGGIEVNGIGMWNGQSWSSLGQGAGGSFYGGVRLTWHDGKLWNPYSGTDVDYLNGHSGATWNGTNWSHIDTSANAPRFYAFDSKGNLYLDFNASMHNAGSATLTNDGNANADPVLVFKGEEIVYSGSHTWDYMLWWIKNETTNQTIYLYIRVNKGETITFDFRRGRKKIISSTRGDVTRYVLPSSDFANFHLAPGENQITAFINNGSGVYNELISYAYWTIPHDYIGGGII